MSGRRATGMDATPPSPPTPRHTSRRMDPVVVGGGGWTCTPTGAEVVVAPRSSVVRALNVWLPTVAVQVAVYGALPSLAMIAPSTRKSTRAMAPSLSAAVAAMLTATPAATVDAGAGALIATDGATLP